MKRILFSVLAILGLYGMAPAALLTLSAGTAAADCLSVRCEWRQARRDYYLDHNDNWYEDGEFGWGEATATALTLRTLGAVSRQSQQPQYTSGGESCTAYEVSGELYLQCGARWLQQVAPQTWTVVDDPR